MDTSSILRQSLEYWGNPSDIELPDETFINSANRCLRQRELDLELTPDACFAVLKSDPFQFADSTAREFTISDVLTDLDQSRITRVESRIATSTSEDDWLEETRGSYENWNDIMERSGNFCAIYGTPPDQILVTNRDVSDMQFRLVYKQIQPNIASTSTALAVPDIYEPVLVYDIALDIGMLIDNRSPDFLKDRAEKMPYLEARLKDALDRIDRWLKSQKGTAVTRRRRFDDRVPVLNTSRKRFTVTFPG